MFTLRKAQIFTKKKNWKAKVHFCDKIEKNLEKAICVFNFVYMYLIMQEENGGVKTNDGKKERKNTVKWRKRN